DVQFVLIAVNDPATEQVFAIPDSAAEEADKAAAGDEYSPMKIVKVGNGVYHALGYSHHTLIVEFPQWLALVDSPYTETQAKVLFRAIQQQFPTKPVKFVAVSHHHYDHIGGVRTAAAMGATILERKEMSRFFVRFWRRGILIPRMNSTNDAIVSLRSKPAQSKFMRGRRSSARVVNRLSFIRFRSL